MNVPCTHTHTYIYNEDFINVYIITSYICQFTADVWCSSLEIKLQQASANLYAHFLSIFADPTNAVIWTISILPRVFNSSNLYFNVFSAVSIVPFIWSTILKPCSTISSILRRRLSIFPSVSVSLFNGISTSVGYLILKSAL